MKIAIEGRKSCNNAVRLKRLKRVKGIHLSIGGDVKERKIKRTRMNEDEGEGEKKKR